MKKIVYLSICLLVCLFVGATDSHALVWDWSFNGESGHFITDGTDYSAGTYSVTDFVVISSPAGAALGSWSGGQYSDMDYGNGAPYFFDWDGSAITALTSSQDNWDSWFTFMDLVSFANLSTPVLTYEFGWETGNHNTLTHAVLFTDDIDYLKDGCCRQQSYVYSVIPSNPVPEPSTYLLLGSGIVGLIVWRRKKKLKG